MLGDYAPSDWGIADKTEWVAEQPLEGEARMPALEGRDVVGFSEVASFAVKLAPGKPPGARQWRDINNRPVELDSSNNTWKLSKAPQQPQTSPAQRMSKAFDRESSTGRIPEKSRSKEPSTPAEEINSDSVKSQVKELETRKQENPTEEQKKIEFNKNEYLRTMVDAILADSSAGKGAGKYDLSRDDMETYLSYLNGNKPTIPSHDISEEDVDQVIDSIKRITGKGSGFSRFINSVKRKGAPPSNLQSIARARSVLKHYLSTGGVSSITGQRIPFSEAQLDHRISLTNGGIDSPDNWEWVEARFNQFKREFTDDVVTQKLKNALAKSPLEDQRKTLEKEIKNLSRNAYKSHFKANGFDGLSREDVLEAQGALGEQFLKSIAEVAKIPYYESNKAGAEARTRANYVGNKVLKDRILSSMNLQSRSSITNVDNKLSEITSNIAQKQTQVKEISTQIRKEKAVSRRSNKANLSEADYMEILKAKRAAYTEGQGADYADSMVFYRGKVLGRCPAGTTRSGKTCVPGASATPKGPGYNTPDLGGLTLAQVRALSKAKSTDDIIKAHQKQDRQ
jgi:hypothetical protein